jgi:hypothetical protein
MTVLCCACVRRYGQQCEVASATAARGHDGRLQLLVSVETDCQSQGPSGVSSEGRHLDLHVFSRAEDAWSGVASMRRQDTALHAG